MTAMHDQAPGPAGDASVPTDPARKFVQVDFVADVVCPWCYIGKRHLELAAALVVDEIDVGFTWRAFELDPGVPQEGYDRRDYLAAKFGSDPERLKAMAATIEHAGAQVGLNLRLDRIRRRPNTADAHRIIHWAKPGRGGEKGQWMASELLFAAYWQAGADLGDRVLLAAIAGEAGIEPEFALARMEQGTDLDVIRAEHDQASAMGVQGVPAFIFNRKAIITGAHPPETLARALRQTAEQRHHPA